MPNRLAASTSPYLRQHAGNPVDWWEWGSEALAEARRRDVPVLLSVGYAACHWCHVMAHESFEDESIAALMNEHFVNVKVDREERPDVDAVYMNATQAMTGHGGWPMTCFLTPDGEPFHCGTYYPPLPRQGMPSFPQLLQAVARTWADRADEVRASAADVTAQLAKQGWKLTPVTVGPDVLDKAVRLLGTQFDAERGGFGSAPKFPPSMTLEFLLRHVERTGSQPALDMATATFEAMARGGMYDQLGGGFARYSVDAEWVVPHFEKMLYDNALLLRAYAHWARLPGAPPLGRRVAEETAEFLLRDLRTAEGGFASSLDADAAGSEGSTYVWTPAQLADALGDDDARFAAMVFDVTTRGTFEHGASVLQLRADPPDLDRFLAVRSGLLALRALRPQPPRDDKVVTAWNGLAITALAEAGAALGHASWIAAAVDAATLLFDVHVVDGRLRRSSRDGAVGQAVAVLEDHASFAHGLLALHQATADPGWLDAACWLLDTALDRFTAEEPGSFHDTADDAEQLFARPRDPSDNASPSGASALAEALLTASALTGSARYREAADAALAAVGSLVRQAPRFAGHWLSVAEAAAHGPLQVAVSSSGSLASSGSLLAVARAAAPGGAVVLGGRPDAEGLPLLADRPLQGGSPTAYVCRGFVCDRPVTTATELEALLRPVR